MLHFSCEIDVLQEVNFEGQDYIVHYFQFLFRIVMKIDGQHFPIK